MIEFFWVVFNGWKEKKREKNLKLFLFRVFCIYLKFSACCAFLRFLNAVTAFLNQQW